MSESMFSLTGQVVNVFVAPTGTDKEGNEYGGQDKVQIIGDVPLKNGDTRKDLITLTTDVGTHFKSLVGSSVTLPVAFYAPSKGQVSFYIPKGYTPTSASKAA